MILYIASSNPGKLRDFAAAQNVPARHAAADGRISLAPLPRLGDIPAPAEDQPTFEGNARLKAIFYSQHAPNEIVLADDSGLEVDALHGAPGVRSARFAEDRRFSEPGTLDARNNRCLQHALAPFPGPRPARYRCVLAAARNGQILCSAEGAVEGEILREPRGSLGFGYDPLFYLPSLGKTMAELDTAEKLTFSHRGKAFTALLTRLLDQNQAQQIQQQST